MTAAHDTKEPAPKTRLFGMQIPAELDTELTEAASSLNLTKSAVARMALQKGLPFVIGKLEKITAKP